MSQIEKEARALVSDLPLSQDRDLSANRCVENIANKEETVKIPELLMAILDTMLQVPNEEFVDLYFQWKLYLLHENEWWVNATHNNRNQIDRKHLLVLCRMNYLELELMKNQGRDFYSKMSLLNLRTNLGKVCSIAVSVSNIKRNKCSKFLKNKRKEYLALRNEIGMVPSCYQNMSLEMDVFFDHKPLCNNCCRLPNSKVKKVKGSSEKDKRTVTNRGETISKKGKFEGNVVSV